MKKNTALWIERFFITFTYVIFITQVLINSTAYGLEPSTAEIDFHNEPKVFDFHNVISLYQPNYFLVFYQNSSPDYRMYNNRTPGNVKLRNTEAKAQFSLYIPLWQNMFGNENLRLYFAYTQLFLWQIYTSENKFIREVNYEPMLWIRYHCAENMFLNLLYDHQSNGKGGYMEVSWDRGIGSFEFTTKNWYTQFSAWIPFFLVKANNHNAKSIPHYLGYDKIVLSYNYKDFVLSVEGQNIESGFTRGHIMGSMSYSATTYIKLYLQFFSGYGQTLIEYDHHTISYGIGLALSDWQ